MPLGGNMLGAQVFGGNMLGAQANPQAISQQAILPTFKEYMRRHEDSMKYYSAKVAELTELLSILRTNPDIQRAMILMGQIREGE